MTTRRRDGLVLLGWALAVGAAIAWGTRLRLDRPEIKVGAAPFFGRWGPEVGSWPALAGAVAFGALVVAGAPRLARRLPWPALLAAVAATAAGWVLVLSTVGGAGDVVEPLRDDNEYLAGIVDVDAAGGVGDFLATFEDDLAGYPIHVQGHPPGVVVSLWAVDDLGVDPAATGVVAIVVGWASVAVSAAVALRVVAGEEAARRAAPFLAVVPGAVWAGTSFDGLFAGVVGAGIALVVVATHRSGRRAAALGGTGGALVGGAMLLSYSVVPVLAVPTVVALAARRLRALVVAGIVAAGVLVVAGAAGFWWPAGLAATRERYEAGVASARPFTFFVVANLVVVSVAAGPAVVVALAGAGRRLLDQGILALAALVAVLAADLSGLSKGEVERIWLPFVPWLATATALLAGSPRRVQALLALQVGIGVAAQVGIRSPW